MQVVGLVPKEDTYYTYKLKIEYYYLIEPSKTSVVYKIGYSGNVRKRITSIGSTEKPSSQVRGLGLRLKSVEILELVECSNKSEALLLERELLNLHNYNKFTGKVLASGNAELFTTLEVPSLEQRLKIEPTYSGYVSTGKLVSSYFSLKQRARLGLAN